MRNNSHHGGDNESLQADVMRFMAIIGFCLIAILALVRNVDAPPEPNTQPAQVQLAQTPPPIVPVARVTTKPAERRVLVVRQQPAAPEPVPARPEPAEPEPEPVSPIVPEPVPVLAPVPAPIKTAPAEPEPVQPEPIESEPEVQTADAAAPQVPQDEPGLTLRFASDRDFLRLIARGDVTVYALREDRVLGLGKDYEFRRSSAPGHIYELNLATIPNLVSAAFRRSSDGGDGFTWGVALPGRIESQIRNYVQTQSSGVLLIDRFGEVRYVGTT